MTHMVGFKVRGCVNKEFDGRSAEAVIKLSQIKTIGKNKMD